MDESLKRDLIAILLEECSGYSETHARKLAAGNIHINDLGKLKKSDIEARDAADHAINRIEARCGTIAD